MLCYCKSRRSFFHYYFQIPCVKLPSATHHSPQRSSAVIVVRGSTHPIPLIFSLVALHIFFTITELTKRFAKFVSGYRMYDLRHTFATRCQTCGVPQHVVARWLGHKLDKITDNTYTHFPPEFILKMAKKVEY